MCKPRRLVVNKASDRGRWPRARSLAPDHSLVSLVLCLLLLFLSGFVVSADARAEECGPASQNKLFSSKNTLAIQFNHYGLGWDDQYRIVTRLCAGSESCANQLSVAFVDRKSEGLIIQQIATSLMACQLERFESLDQVHFHIEIRRRGFFIETSVASLAIPLKDLTNLVGKNEDLLVRLPSQGTTEFQLIFFEF